MNIRAYLGLMVAGIFIPVIVLSTVAFSLLLDAQRDTALKGVRETARTALVSIERELSNAQAAMRVLATSPDLASGDIATFYQQARHADKEGVRWTALLDENGQQLMNTALPFGAPMWEEGAAERVNKALLAGRAQVSNVIRGTPAQGLLVVVDLPISTPFGQRYVLAQGIRVEQFQQVLGQIKTAPGWLAGVFDRNGIAIARKAGVDEGAEPRADLREAIRNKTAGVIHNASDKQVKLYTVLERSELAGWTVALGVPEAQIEAAARAALTVSLFGLLAALACAAVAALVCARRLSRSVGEAARAATALARGEALPPAAGSGVREVDEVHVAITAAATVISAEKQSRQLAETEREQLFALEHAARTLAERQNREKDVFLAMLGHELRNPLSAIVNAANVAGMQDVPAEVAQRAHAIIARQSRHLSRIVDDLLDVGRVHSGKILLERQPLRLDHLLSATLATLRETGRLAQHAVSVSCEAAWVMADATRLEQILSNLLDNALKYTPPGGAIAVALRVDGTQLSLSVSDTGVGIAPELMPYVFDLFVQGTPALDRPLGGLGVGLALVRQLAHMHGGSVSVHSEGVGKGSRFELRLPALENPVLEPAAPARVRATRQCVLLIEDNDDGRDTMAMMLASQDYRVIAAAEGKEGLRLAAQEAPDIALIDIGLPGIDGYEVARRLRAHARTGDMRLIALTGYGQEEDQRRALAAGFDVHLVKPVELERLIAALEASTEEGASA
ncbi:MAG: ATP-binding protein [Pseudomonadota bacterium]